MGDRLVMLNEGLPKGFDPDDLDDMMFEGMPDIDPAVWDGLVDSDA